MDELYDDYDELDDYNPYDDEGMLVIAEKPKKRKRKRNPEPVAIATPLLLLVAGYLGWCAYAQTKTGLWNWQPWRTMPLGRRRLLKVPNTTEAQRQEARRQADLDRATEAMMAPAFSVEEVDLWRRPTHYDSEREIVSFITP